MPKAFLVLVIMVVLVSVFFGLVIWRQTVKFEKKAGILKEKKEKYIQELEEEEARRAQEKQDEAADVDADTDTE